MKKKISTLKHGYILKEMKNKISFHFPPLSPFINHFVLVYEK